MNIDKWLDENTCFDSSNEEILVPLSKFQALMETHAIVPREPSDEMIAAGFLAVNENDGDAVYPEAICYKAMIKATEEEK